MINLTFVEFNGEEHRVSVQQGSSLMQAAIENFVPGIDADCGGSCACGTCHVKLDQAWLSKVETPSESESLMLEMTPEHDECSRLACQITVQADMDGMIVKLPEFQM
ncbi:Ferredoxin-6 [Zhongshania aliphaticivorans]|uniref:Ferredoxin-6 n=1 Tax=Zhongshania aliphaticivorans TaxID=1470434 RepID=A0A5S9QLC0_9GAMM|nr:2Fe-2S iron-sulfur cluster-binding protein [Zhongshania aliphaticivorans]CAA0111329.1 Ferredoxin-6 [Zhongshania aliphaticivorans]CAA0118575.1 Ferredoxin-6 [Zhongshania aliphaticivorans]